MRLAWLAAPLLLGACSQQALHGPPPVCIDSYRIDHTDIPDDSTIIFVMRDRTRYRAALINGCPGLRADPRGFTYAPIPGSNQICADLQSIRLNTYGGVCLIGKIQKE